MQENLYNIISSGVFQHPSIYSNSHTFRFKKAIRVQQLEAKFNNCYLSQMTVFILVNELYEVMNHLILHRKGVCHYSKYVNVDGFWKILP